MGQQICHPKGAGHSEGIGQQECPEIKHRWMPHPALWKEQSTAGTQLVLNWLGSSSAKMYLGMSVGTSWAWCSSVCWQQLWPGVTRAVLMTVWPGGRGSSKTMSAVLCPVLILSNKWWAGVSSTSAYRLVGDWSAALWGRAEEIGLVQSGEEKALEVPNSSNPASMGRPSRMQGQGFNL